MNCGWDVITRKGLDPASVLFADFEHPYLWEADLEALMEAHRLLHPERATKLLLLDEIQRLPDWDSWLEVLADHWPDTPFIATGSAAIPLLEGSFESGPGRWEELELPPLLFSEYLAMAEPRLDAISFSPISLRSVARGEASPEQTDLASAGPPLGQHWRAYLARGGFPEAAKPQQTVEAAQRAMRKGREVDFLVELPGAPLIGIEIKYRNTFKGSFVDGLVAFAKTNPQAKTILLVPAAVAAQAPVVPDGIVVWAVELFTAGLGLQVAQDQGREYPEEGS